MTNLSFGTPDGSHLARPTFADNTFQFTGQGPRDLIPMPIGYRGPTFGGGGASQYPARSLDLDGYFMSPVYLTSDGNPYVDGVNTPLAGYGPQMVGPLVTGPGHGTEFFDFAADAEGKTVYMIWSGMTSSVSGTVESYNERNASGVITGVNPLYNPGSFDSESLTGVMGSFRAWFPLTRVQDADFSAYVPGSKLTISKGRLKLITSGTPKEVGTVERVSATKVLVLIKL